MAKPFGKIINNWRHLPSTTLFLTALSNSRKSTNSDNLIVTKRGAPETGGGTWMHEDGALEFYLNPGLINATEMARPFGKYPAEWRRLPTTVRLVTSFEKTKGKSLSIDNIIFTEVGSTKN